MRQIINEVCKGNGNQFTVKEILSAHIKDGKDFEKYVRDKFDEGAGKIAGNRASVASIWKVLKYCVMPLMVAIIGTLVGMAL